MGPLDASDAESTRPADMLRTPIGATRPVVAHPSEGVRRGASATLRPAEDHEPLLERLRAAEPTGLHDLGERVVGLPAVPD